ncbi:hypothetical protein [Nocardiopsis composta]|uniref:Lipoprotein n=1 Tax=Nocardiopsis composta TaxID=157465 RepID=A0A7W8QMR5_9ACTN|nr:hypothetical protein [Nocardiopsis composta]MBB5432854.1 hypothetical protein [Nocardiopsis composta]
MTRRRNAARSLPAFAALIGAALLTAGCAGLPGPGGGTAGEAPAGKPSSPQPEQEAEEASEESAEPGGAFAGGQAAWGMPAALGDWEMDAAGENGIYNFTRENGCQVTLSQNTGAEADAEAGLTPADAVDAIMDRTGQEVQGMSVQAGEAREVSAPDGTAVVFETRQATYTGQDGVDYTLRAGAEWIDDVELVVMTSCPTAEWDTAQGDFDEFFDETSVEVLPG